LPLDVTQPIASASPPGDDARVPGGRGVVAAGLLLGLAVLGYLLAFPPTLNQSDEALFLYGAKRILEGQALYRDFFEFITPAGFYLFALAYAVGGTTIQAARATMAAVNALGAALVYILARKVAGELEAVLATVVFAVACVPVWHVASPHWLSTCLCLATAAAVLADRWAGSARLRPALAGALAGLAFATQQQRGVFLGAWLVAALLLLPGDGGGPLLRRWLRALAWAAVGWAPVVAAILGYAMWRSSPALLVNAVFTHVLFAYRPHHVGMSGWGATSWLTSVVADYTWPWIPTVIPVVLLAEAILLVARAVRHRGREECVRAALLLLAGAMAGAIFYFPDLIHVAFVFPFTLVVAAGMVHRLRLALWAHPRLRPIDALARVALTIGLLVVLHKGWRNVALARLQYPVREATAFGTIANNDTGRDIVAHLRRSVSVVPDDRRRVFSYPADASLYLTLPATNPTPFSLLRPGYNTAEQFQAVFDALGNGGADFVIVAPLFVNPATDPVLQFLPGRYVRQERLGVLGPDVYAPVRPRAGPAAP
jgi:4-amino-4-deoxy-L-arabinose transferase-like glycosyltransferase